MMFHCFVWLPKRTNIIYIYISFTWTINSFSGKSKSKAKAMIHRGPVSRLSKLETRNMYQVFMPVSFRTFLWRHHTGSRDLTSQYRWVKHVLAMLASSWPLYLPPCSSGTEIVGNVQFYDTDQVEEKDCADRWFPRVSLWFSMLTALVIPRPVLNRRSPSSASISLF